MRWAIQAGFVMGVLSGVAGADAGNPVRLDVADGTPPGFSTLVVSYGDTKDKMLADIRAGRGNVWLTWLEPGRKRNDSMYVWLAAEWYRENKMTDEAYRAAVLGLLLTDMDLRICDINVNKKEQIQLDWLREHAWIKDLKPSQKAIKSAVVEAVKKTETMLQDKRPTSGMACLWYKVAHQPAIPARRRQAVITVTSSNYSFNQLVSTQQFAVNEFKKRHHYDISWDESDISTVWPGDIK